MNPVGLATNTAYRAESGPRRRRAFRRQNRREHSNGHRRLEQRLSTGALSPATAPPRDRRYLTQPNAKGQAHEAGGQTSTADRPPLGCTASADSLNATAGNYCAPDSSQTRAQYQYDATGERKTKRTIQNAGYDTLYVNPWLTVQVQQTRTASAGDEGLARQQEKRSEYVLEGDTRFLAKLNLPTKSCAQRIDPTLNPLSQDSDHTRFHTHSDHLGSVNVLTDHCGDVIEHTEQLPYGLNWKQDNSTDPNSNSHATAAGQNNAAQEYGFTGKPEDAESNLIYYGARYYDPRAAVWLSPDPIWEDYFEGKGGMGNAGIYSAMNLSLYAQAAQNPIRYVDPDGKEICAYSTVKETYGGTLLCIDNGQMGVQSMTVHELYKTGSQWFEPLADNYMQLTYVSDLIKETPGIKHSTWNDILNAALVDRPSLAYMSGGPGDWKKQKDGGAGYIMTEVSGFPYWTDALGQIPFAVDTFYSLQNNKIPLDSTIISVVNEGRIWHDGFPHYISPSADNGYDNYFILRGAKAAADLYLQNYRPRAQQILASPVSDSDAIKYGIKH